MFIKPNKFEKLIKTAYKAGRLHVGNDGLNFLAAGALGGAGWSMAMEEELIPKELKAIIIKYVGRMPAKGEYFLALSDGDQAEVEGAFCIGEEDTKNLQYAEATHLVYVKMDHAFNIFQSVSEKYDFMIAAPLIDTIDESAIDEMDGELGISGPYLDRAGRQMIIENDRMQLRLFIQEPPDDEAEALLDFLKEKDLNAGEA